MILYADKETKSIKSALAITNRRREIQIAHNKKNGITPTTTKKSFGSALANLYTKKEGEEDAFEKRILTEREIENLKKEMLEAAANLDFEKAGKIRDEVRRAESLQLM